MTQSRPIHPERAARYAGHRLTTQPSAHPSHPPVASLRCRLTAPPPSTRAVARPGHPPPLRPRGPSIRGRFALAALHPTRPGRPRPFTPGHPGPLRPGPIASATPPCTQAHHGIPAHRPPRPPIPLPSTSLCGTPPRRALWPATARHLSRCRPPLRGRPGHRRSAPFRSFTPCKLPCLLAALLSLRPLHHRDRSAPPLPDHPGSPNPSHPTVAAVAAHRIASQSGPPITHPPSVCALTKPAPNRIRRRRAHIPTQSLHPLPPVLSHTTPHPRPSTHPFASSIPVHPRADRR